MSRTNSSAVKALLLPGKDYDLDRAPSLTPFIDSASAIVSRVAACAIAKGEPLSSSELELIERWAAAHLYVCSDQTYASKSTEGASASFHGQTGMHFESSRYGQTALSLDFSGCLSAITEKRVASAAWLGRPPSEQTDYGDRD